MYAYVYDALLQYMYEKQGYQTTELQTTPQKPPKPYQSQTKTPTTSTAIRFPFLFPISTPHVPKNDTCVPHTPMYTHMLYPYISIPYIMRLHSYASLA